MVTTRNIEEQTTRDLIRELQAQIEAQAQTIQAQAYAQQEMRRRHEEEMRALRVEREPAEQSASNRENANEASHIHVNPKVEVTGSCKSPPRGKSLSSKLRTKTERAKAGGHVTLGHRQGAAPGSFGWKGYMDESNIHRNERDLETV
ncbi:hypothetical protein LR48_Vigan02g260000 [Vigna angularis]|uniref:Uncharacterized protein n=1 Tax=Phaseolus angularis TaxID=3914 RepID=A0A0L9U104_PHAAN|nr:hypothetical protein LR48_Vigan02g260000 [Vigna angularis]